MPGSKKKGKATKSVRRSKKKGPKEDVKSSTSLPPAVEGPLRCFLRVTITKVTWTTPKLPDATHARLRWWGETSSGTLFRPIDGKNQGKAESQTVARFPVRCGPKQFAAYLNDMGSVSLDVLRGPSMAVAGRAQINEISAMSPQNPISGTYPVFSVKDSQKIAEVQIAMVFEPLITSYDSSSSLPTTDASYMAPSRPTNQDSVRSKASRRSTSSHDSSRSGKKKIFPGSSSTEGPFTSGNSKVPSDAIQHDFESDYSSVIGHSSKPTIPEKTVPNSQDILRRPLSTLPITSNTRSLPIQQMSNTVPDRLNSDLISALLDRGKKLRDAMIKEELGQHSSKRRPLASQGTEDAGVIEIHEGQRRYGRRGSTGELFHELLHGDRDEVPVRDGDPAVALGNPDDDDDDDNAENADTENRAVELLVGDVLSAKDLKNLKALHSGISPPGSVSSHSDSDYSEEEDPLHDNSILEELFYKGVASSSSESLADLLDSDSSDAPESRTIKRTKQGKTQDAASPRRKPDVENASSLGYLDPNAADDAVPGRSRPVMEEGEKEEESSRSLSESRTSGSLSLASSLNASHQTRGHHGSDPASGLSVERLTLLGRVHVARVTVDKLTLRSEQASRIPVRVGSGADQRSKGKPPRPSTQKKITYFVEYQFPVSEASSGRNGSTSSAMATELMRVVSKKVSGKEVSFGHRSVFPVQFDGQAVDRWWRQLLVFKVFSKIAGDKHPSILGVASIPLRSLIQSPDLVTVSELPVKDKTSPSRTTDHDSSQRGSMIGVISVSMELASDSKDFASALAKTRVAEMQGAKIVPLPSSDPRARLGHLTGQTPSSSWQQSRDGGQAGMAVKTSPEIPAGHSEADVGNLTTDTSDHQTKQTTNTKRDTPKKHQDSLEALTLHSLLYVRDGQIITTSSSLGHMMPRPHPHPSLQYFSGGRDRLVHNAYLVGRMFWLDDAARSDVCWGTTQPNFDYVQVSPVLLTQSLLERMRNNFMVIEVWDKKTSAQHDQLLGIAKLPLHQLYMSYRDLRIGKTLLKSQYPVVAVDNEVPITDPFSGQRCGQLTILLALGSQQQVSALQRLKSIRRDATDVPERPIQYGERADVQSSDHEVQDSGAVEHVFEVVIEGIQGLPQLEDSVWGEADCFVQYHFPHQQQQLQQQQEYGGLIQDSSLTLRPHRTATTLCVPDPVFNDVCRHRIVLVQGTPVQRELLTACAGVGGHAGGIPFEVWCRFYYPNVRDQVIAKATLPLAKLCAMVTMQRRGEPSVQTFSLPLRTHQDDQQRAAEEAGHKFHDGGLLDVTVSYRQTAIHHHTHPSRDMGATSGGPHVSLALTIHRACGLKAAATSLARHDSGMQYPSQVGVNSYIKIQLSFMARDEMRVTRTIARSFCPEYNHHVELPCPLLLAPREEDDDGGDATSLAEALESADLILQVWHQVPGLRSGDSERPHRLEDTLPRGGAGVMGHRVIAETGDVLIGSATIHLVKLLANRTGIEGWFPISLPPMGWDTAPLDRPLHDLLSDTPDDMPPQPHPKLLDRVAGGVELAVKFGHQGDRERVIDAGRKVGWSPDRLVLEDVEEIWDDGLQGQTLNSSLTCEVTIDVDAAWFSIHSSLRPGQVQLDPHTKAYIRYKFYDKGAVCSKLCYLDQTGQGQLCADLKHCHVLHANQSQPFAWYLREEQLEVQLWLSYNSELNKESKARPRHRDKLIGCAYIDLSPLCHQRVKRHRVSGVFPLFKPGCSDMGGACLRAHVSMKVTSEPKPAVATQKGQPERALDEEILDEETQPRDDIIRDSDEAKEVEREKKQPVWMTVVVERAMHLSDFTDPSRVGSIAPSSYVTFQSAVGPSPAVTPTIPSSKNPHWKYTRDVAISPQLLDNQSLIFKIWHQVSSKQDSTCDRVLGFTSVDLGPLLAGIRSLDGWYNIMDFSGQTLGQIKISITPKETLSPLRHSPKQRAMLGSPNSSNLFSRAPLPPPHYLHSTSSSNQPGSGSLPPTHPAVRSLDHFQQHLEGVREFHGKLQERLRSLHRMETEAGSVEEGTHHTTIQDPPAVGIQQSNYQSHLLERTPSSSYLLENFRKNMEELDALHQRLKTKLSGGGTSSLSSSLPNATSATVQASHHHGNSSDVGMSVRNHDEEGEEQDRHDDAHYGRGNVMTDDHRMMPQGNENNNQQYHQLHHHHHHQQQLHHESGHGTILGDGEERTGFRGEDSERTSNWSTEGDPSDEASHEHPDRDGYSGGDFTEDTRSGRGTMDLKYDDSSMRRKDVLRDDDGGGGYQFQEDGTGRDDQDSMVYVRPLNDISSAAFSNGISDNVISPPASPPTSPPHHVPSSSYPGDRYTSEQHAEDEQHHEDGRNHHRYDEFKSHDGSDDHISGRDRVSGTTDMEEYPALSSGGGGGNDGYHANQNSDVFPGGMGGDGEQDHLHPHQGIDPVSQAGLDGMNREMDDSDYAQRGDPSQGFGTDDLHKLDTESDHSNSVSGATWTIKSSTGTSHSGPDDDSSNERGRRSSHDDDVVEDGIVLTLNAQEAELQRRQVELEEAERSAAVRPKIHGKNVSSTLPDFFLPPSDLEASMRALYNTVSGPPSHELSARDRAKFEAAQEMAQRLSSAGHQRSQTASRTSLPFSFKQPTADQAKRIAKIFSTKF